VSRLGVTVATALVVLTGSSAPTLGAFLQVGYAFPFAEYRDGQWRESVLPGSPGPWTFHPFQSVVSRAVESGAPVPTTFCGDLVGPLMPVREAYAVAGKQSSKDVHAAFGLLHRGPVRVVPLLERGAGVTPRNAFTRVDDWLRRELDRASVPTGSTQVVKAWMTADESRGASVVRVEVDVFPPGDQMRLWRLEAWLVLPVSGDVHAVERSLEPDAGDGIKTSMSVHPLGVVTIDGRAFIVTDEHGWEHVDYVIREQSGNAPVERLRVLGPCAG